VKAIFLPCLNVGVSIHNPDVSPSHLIVSLLHCTYSFPSSAFS
jgi:hypothetical protein